MSHNKHDDVCSRLSGVNTALDTQHIHKILLGRAVNYSVMFNLLCGSH